MFKDLTNPTIGKIIEELKKYLSDAYPVFNVGNNVFKTEIYPLNPHNSGLSVKITEGNIGNSVYIELE